MAFVNHGVASCALGLIALFGGCADFRDRHTSIAIKQAEPANAEPANL